MTEQTLRQVFKNNSDCYADTIYFENDGSYSEGEVIQAMSEDRFVKIVLNLYEQEYFDKCIVIENDEHHE